MSYLSPGVYVEEVPSGAAPITGVSTSTAGFVGLVPDDTVMPEGAMLAAAGVAKLVTNWTEFTHAFGGPGGGGVTTKNALAHAVRGFFANGGSRCWVVRVAALAATGDADPIAAALDRLAEIDEIALVAAPVISDDGARIKAIQELVLGHCETLGERFAILDAPLVVTQITAADIVKVRHSDYGALYFPWIDVTGSEAYCPPSGHIAGVFARVDSERGVHKAPANEAVRGALGLRYRVTRAQHDGLNNEGVNVIRPFGQTNKVYGARTLADRDNAKQAEFTYINVRRLFCFLRESIQDGTGWVVFEPNTPDLWARVTRNVRAFLTEVWQSGALFGRTADEAFRVKCDAENNPPQVRDTGKLVAEIAVAPVRPTEFVIFKLSQFTGVGR
jgi:phage tail sheath protein FI